MDKFAKGWAEDVQAGRSGTKLVVGPGILGDFDVLNTAGTPVPLRAHAAPYDAYANTCSIRKGTT
jgi:hypothetical protein